MKKLCLIGIMIYIATLSVISRPALTAPEILDKIDENMVFNTAYSEVEMIVTIKNRAISREMRSYAEGNQKSFIEVLSPARDKGTKILKDGEVLKVYYPSAERMLRLSGHMLRQSMMGSDFSYEDMTEKAKKLREEYTAEIKAEETINHRPCYLLVMTSKIKKQTYFTRKTWVDKEHFLVLKEEMYAVSGKLLKVLTTDEVKPFKNRFYPTRVTMQDKLRKDSRTEMILKKMEFDVAIPPDTFSERELMKR